MSKKEIIIKVNPNASLHPSQNPNGYLPNKENELVKFILDRINKLDKKLDFKMEYEIHNRHDSILIDGTRGVGKSTVIKYLKNHQSLKETCVLNIIDPNQLDKKDRDNIILDIIVNNIYNSVKKEKLYSTKKSTKQLFNDICSLKSKLEILMFETYKKSYSDASTKSKITNYEMLLDHTIHEYAYKACEYLNKKALILPIDDIDMALDIGSDIVETLRKYLRTPRIIPIMALDSGQIYALVKKEYFDKFGYEAKTPLKSIKSNSEMSFLKKLPSEYMQKILPPSQRVILPDMLEHYKQHLQGKNHISFEYEVKNNLNETVQTIILSFDDLLRVFMNVVFGYDGNDIESIEDYHVINYLKNKTFRSFMDDINALLDGLIWNEDKQEYILVTEKLKTRFRLYSKDYASNQYDGALWFWDQYIQRVYTKLEDIEKKTENDSSDSMTLELIESILTVSSDNSSDLQRKEKIYYRLFLKDFFIRKITLKISKDNNANPLIKKEIDIPGYIEFMLRTIFPASIFEVLYNERIISLTEFPLEKLKEFSNSDSKSTLIELYDEFVPFISLNYSYDDKNPSKALAVSLAGIPTRPFRKRILNFTVKDNIFSGKQTYYLHPFKFITFMSEFRNTNDDKFIYKYLPKGHLNADAADLNSFKVHLKSFLEDKLSIEFTNSNFGIMSSIKSLYYTGNIVGNLLKVNDNKQSFYEELKKLPIKSDTLHTLYRKEALKNISNIEAIFINMFIVNMIENNNYINRELENRDPRFDLHKGYTYTGNNHKNMLLPFIVDDPTLRNLNLLTKLNLEKNNGLSEYIRRYFKLSNMENNYLLSSNIVKFFENSQHGFQVNQKKYIREYINTIDKSKTIKNAYFDLFQCYLKNNKKRIVTLLNKINDLQSDRDNPKEFNEERIRLKKEYENEKELLREEVLNSYYRLHSHKKEISINKIFLDKMKNEKTIEYNNNFVTLINQLLKYKFKYEENEDILYKNITILLLDMIVFSPKMINKLVEYLNVKKED